MTATFRILIISAIILEITAVKFTCHYGIISLSNDHEINICYVENTEIFHQNSTTIDGLTSKLQLNKSGDDIEGFYIRDNPSLHFFPKGVENVIKPVICIAIVATNLKHISQSDLMVFPELTHLMIPSNKIEVLPAGLFKFNPKLSVFRVNLNPLRHIDPMVFSQLGHLVELEIGKCENGVSFNLAINAGDVRMVVKRVESGACSEKSIES